MYSLHELSDSYFDAEILFSQLFMGKKSIEIGFDPHGGRFEEKAGKDPTITIMKQKYNERELAPAPEKVDNPHDFLYLIDPTRKKPSSVHHATPSRRSQSATYSKSRSPSKRFTNPIYRSSEGSQLGGTLSHGRNRLQQVDSESESLSE